MQPVVDDRRDLPAVDRGGRLALDHRGDDQHVVARQSVLRRVAEVDAARRARERLQLLGDEDLRRGRPHELVGRGEQEALHAEALVAGRPVAGRRMARPRAPRGTPDAECRSSPTRRTMSRIANPSGMRRRTVWTAVVGGGGVRARRCRTRSTRARAGRAAPSPSTPSSSEHRHDPSPARRQGSSRRRGGRGTPGGAPPPPPRRRRPPVPARDRGRSGS